MSRIFISYKRVDKDKVFKIKDQIESALGEKCWIDLDGIESDAQFANVIIDAINNCEVFLFMYSKAHMEISDYENDWTIRELNFAQDKKKRIVFINIDRSELTDWFKLLFASKQHVDGASFDSLEHLKKDLLNWLGATNKSARSSCYSADNYKFIAYILSCDKDERFARYLHRRLENLSYNREDKPLRPIFLEEYEPIIGCVEDVLKENVKSSRFLLVLCSPESARSSYVNKIVNKFCSQNRLKNVCPIIVEGEPYSNNENECYSEALKKYFPKNEGNEHGLQGIDYRNFKDMTGLERDIMLTKMASFLLDVTFDDIWKHRRQTMRMRFLKILHAITK